MYPEFKSFKKTTIFNISLGIISKYFSKKKSFLKSKASFILTSLYLKRIMLNIYVNNIDVYIKGIPLHIKDVLSKTLKQDKISYKSPLVNSNRDIINELNFKVISINYIIFINSKTFNKNKKKKRGRLKRKISKKITKLNNTSD
jgi:2C-methyl-D-erythritol 2,4-cyclodiphosphate synthase